MRVPGILSISCVKASQIPDQVELDALAGVVPSVTGITFTAIAIIGEPVCEVETSNENNGEEEHVSLSFYTVGRHDYRRHVFVITIATGQSFMIGSSNNIPAFSCRDITAGPDTTNRCEVKIELSAMKAWIPLGEVAPYISGDAGGNVNFEVWREITEEEVGSIINALS